METPVGFRFHPTDKELCSHYQGNKNAGFDSLVDNWINTVNICAYEPWELPSLSKLNPENDSVWYFFSPPDPKYPKRQTRKNGEAPIMNRSTKEGSWSPTGKDRKIIENGTVIGFRKTLVFYLGGKVKGKKTNWVMHEYRAASVSPIGRDYVVCKLKYKQDDSPCAYSIQGGQSSADLASSSNVMPEVNDEIQVTSADCLNSFGRSDAKIIDLPYGLDIDLVLPESAMEDDWIDSMTIDPEFQNELLAEPDGYIIQKSVPHTNYNRYTQLQSITGEYTDSSSDTDSETTEQLSFQEIPSPVDSLCTSKGSNKFKVDIQKMDCSTEHSAVTGQFSGDTMTKYEDKAKEVAEPRKAIDENKEPPAKLSSTSTQVMHACTEGSVITETFYKSQDKVTETADSRTMKLKSLLIHLLSLIISIVGLKKLVTAKQIHSNNLQHKSRLNKNTT